MSFPCKQLLSVNTGDESNPFPSGYTSEVSPGGAVGFSFGGGDTAASS